MKRRQLIRGIAAASLAAGASPVIAGMSLGNPGKTVRKLFESEIGQTFCINEYSASECTLTRVITAVPGQGNQQFHVYFDVNGEEIPEGLYTIHTAGGDSQILHLQPVQSRHRHSTMRATFNLA